MGAKTDKNVCKNCLVFFVVVFLVQEYQNCKEVSKWAQINMETLIRVFESVRLMHFIQFCNIITEILLFHSKYLKHFSIFKITCFNKETMTSLSNTTSKLCLITPGVCVCVCGGGGGVGATYFALKDFFHPCDSKYLSE